MKKFFIATLLAALMVSVPAFADENADTANSEGSAVASTEEISAGDGPKADFNDRTTGKKLILKKGQHPAKQGRPLDLDVTVGANWWNANAGLFFDIPIVPNGFSPLNDSFDLEIGTYLGLSWYYGSGYGDHVSFNQDILLGVRYSLYLTRNGPFTSAPSLVLPTGLTVMIPMHISLGMKVSVPTGTLPNMSVCGLTSVTTVSMSVSLSNSVTSVPANNCPVLV